MVSRLEINYDHGDFIMNMQERAEKIQQEANAKIEAMFQDEFEKVYVELKKLYPKRDIKIIFGNGSMVVTGFENLRTHTGLVDYYGNLESNFGTSNPVLDRFPEDHPLLRLIKLQEECFYPENSGGWCVACNDIGV